MKPLRKSHNDCGFKQEFTTEAIHNDETTMRWRRQWDKKGRAELGLLGNGAALREERGGSGYSLERGAADLFRVRVFLTRLAFNLIKPSYL